MYKDINPLLAVHPDTHDITIRTQYAAINQSIVNLVLTSKYERPYNTSIDGKIFKLLFEDCDNDVAQVIKTSIEYLISNFEKRALSVVVNVSVNSTLDGYNVAIQYYTGTLKPTTITLGLSKQ